MSSGYFPVPPHRREWVGKLVVAWERIDEVLRDYYSVLSALTPEDAASDRPYVEALHEAMHRIASVMDDEALPDFMRRWKEPSVEDRLEVLSQRVDALSSLADRVRAIEERLARLATALAQRGTGPGGEGG